MKSLLLAGVALHAMAVMMAPDAGGPTGSEAENGAAATGMTLLDAINSLDPDVDANWTEGGLPDVDVIERLTGNKWISRGDIEGIPITRSAAAERKAAGTVIAVDPATQAPTVVPDVPADPALEPAPAAPDPDTGVTADPIKLDAGASTAVDDPAPAAAQPQKIGRHRIVELSFPDDTPLDGDTIATGLVVKVLDDGSVNAWAFPANGGAPIMVTGVRSKGDRDALAEDDPARNLPAWSWPERK